MYVEVLQLLPGLQYSCNIQGDISVDAKASLKDYSIVKSKVIFSKVIRFDFIECFTTTFLRAHSWLNWVDEDDDEDEVGLKEKPEDTRYIKKITSK